jgi:hypothetical protein
MGILMFHFWTWLAQISCLRFAEEASGTSAGHQYWYFSVVPKLLSTAFIAVVVPSLLVVNTCFHIDLNPVLQTVHILS